MENMEGKNKDLVELTELVSKFIDFANQLKNDGKITEEQYYYITKNKVEFLKETKMNYQAKEKKNVGKDLSLR